jgi:ABC-2 type transport system permease protein
MSDLRTIIWKEWNDLLWSGGRYDLFRPLLVIAILGVVLPLTFEQRWIELDSAAVLIILYTPFMLIISFIGDAIAGERERHTLETLLASRISDHAILMGKVLVAVGFSWGITVFCLLLGAVVVNMSQGQALWVFYAPTDLFIVVLILSLLTNLLAASGGVLISLKSATVRQASQTMILAIILLGLAVYGVARLLPASVTSAMTTSQMVLVIMVTLAVIDVVLLAVSLVSFRRSRLILG